MDINQINSIKDTIFLPFEPRVDDYQILKDQIKMDRDRLSEEFKQVNPQDQIHFLDSVGHFLENTLIYDFFPHWYGTEWDFNGISNQPKEGEIACGYFVSTTLKHIGFELNRFKFAQQASYHEAKMINLGKEPKTYRNLTLDELKKEISADLNQGLYVVGLDNHVGYLFISDDTIYFIHSDYVSDKVCFERIEDSSAFGSSVYVMAPVCHNHELIRSWLNKKAIPFINN